VEPHPAMRDWRAILGKNVRPVVRRERLAAQQPRRRFLSFRAMMFQISAHARSATSPKGNDGVEHRLDVGRRPADHAQYIARCGLLFQRPR
jgi:hypothetical protein